MKGKNQPQSTATPPAAAPSPSELKHSVSNAESATRTQAAPAAAPAADRQQRIAEAAYRRAQTRNFEPGGELEDWLTAEREVDGQ